MTNFFQRFAEWQNYLHYALLTLALVGMILFIDTYYPEYVLDIVVLFFAIVVIDSLIHFVFWVAPEPIRWRD